MKIFIIILFILILVYIILKKKENFQVSDEQKEELKKYYEENPELKLEDINRRISANETSTEMSKFGYMVMSDEYDMERLKNIFTDQHMKFITNSDSGLGILKRSDLFTSTLTPQNENLSYDFFVYNFKGIKVDTSNLDNNYQNPNNIDYIPLFMQQFRPNVMLKLNFIKPSSEVRIRYEIMKKGSRDVMSSGYIAYDKRGCRDYNDEKIQQQFSPMSRMYEPEEYLLSSGRYLHKYGETVDEKTYSNHFVNLHKLIYDIRETSGQADYEKLRKEYRTTDKYKFAFENLNKIEKNKFTPYDGGYFDLLNENGKIKKKELERPVEEDKLQGKNIIFDSSDCLEVKTEFYISPGNYTMNVILDKVEQEDYNSGVLASMEYMVSSGDDEFYNIVKDDNYNPVHLNELKNFRNINKADSSFFVKTSIAELLNELKNISTFIKTPDNTFKVDRGLILLKPERYEPYVNVNLFRILLRYKLIKDDNEDSYKYLFSKLDRFYQSYLMGYNDTRTIGNSGSPQYRSIENRLNRLMRSPNLTVQEEQQLHSLQEQLFEMKDEELERIHGPPGPNKRKIQELKMFFNETLNWSEGLENKRIKIEEKKKLNEKIEDLKAEKMFNKKYERVGLIPLDFIDEAVGKEIILEPYNDGNPDERYVQMAPDGKYNIYNKKVYIRSKLNGKYLSQSNKKTPDKWDHFQVELTDEPTEIEISGQKGAHGKGWGHYIKFSKKKGYLTKSNGPHFVYPGVPEVTWPGRGLGFFWPIRVAKNTYNIFNSYQETNYKTGNGKHKDINWGIAADGNKIKDDYRTKNNPAMEWEIITVNSKEEQYVGYAFDNTITQKNVFKLIKNEDDTYSLEYKKRNEKMYIDNSKWKVVLNPSITKDTKFTIRKGKSDEYVEFRTKNNSNESLMHYHGLGIRWEKYGPQYVTESGSLFEEAGRGAKIPLIHLVRDGELAGAATENMSLNRPHHSDVYKNWSSFKIYTVIALPEEEEEADSGSDDSIGQFRTDTDRFLGQKKSKKTGLDVETEQEKEEQALRDAQPEKSLEYDDFIKVLDKSSASSKKDVINERIKSIDNDLKEIEKATTEESLNELSFLKTETKKEKMKDIINKYLLKYLKNPDGRGSSQIYYDNLLTMLENDTIDSEGLTDISNKSKNPFDYKKPTYSSFDFSIEMKKDKIFTISKKKKEEELKKEKEELVEEEDLDAFTIMVRSIMTEIKKDFRQIIKTKNYEYLSPLLENLLRNLHMKSKNQIGESRVKINRVIKIILNLVDKIKDGSIDDINDLLDSKINEYKFPDEILQENFSNYNTMNPDTIEHFEGDYHKHRGDGRIDFDLQWGNPLLKENEGRYDEYSLLSDLSKSQVVKSYNKMENVLKKASNMVNNYTLGMEAKINNYNSNKVGKSTEQAVNQLEGTLQEQSMANYDDKEQEQREKLNRITDKVKELETLQNKAYVGDSKEFNTIKSFGDGQILSIKNMRNDIYNVLINGECLSYNKRNDVQILPCNSSKDQQFQLNNITDMNQYNNIITRNEQPPGGEFDGLSYPFSMVNPVLHKSQCLTLNGNSVGVKDCMNSNKQRWEGLKNIKNCDKL